MPLPPGVSARDFQTVLRQFEGVVGKEWVFSSDEDVELYRDSYSPFWHEPEDPVPSAAVAPDGVEQVQQIVRIANKFRVPLWTVSTGKNLAYGGSAPRLSGSVLLDLKRMNRILEVNDRNHYALVEPGVSYFDLYRYTQEKGLNVFIDAPDPGWGSPVGNTLDRGGGHTPLRDHFSTLCGLEVVLANGDVVRTGMGALPNSRTWQQYKYGFGPYVDGIFTQSNYGIITKMGVWLYPMPEVRFTGIVSVLKHDELIPMVDTLSYLMNSNIVQGTTRVASSLTAQARDAELAALRSKPGGASIPELEDYLRRKNLPYWSIELPFYGATEVVPAQWAFAKRKFSTIPGVQFRDGASNRLPPSPEDLAKVANPVPLGVPSLAIFSALGPNTYGHIDLSPITPMTGQAVFEVMEVFEKVFDEMGIHNVGVVPAGTYYPRSFFFLFTFPIEHDVEKNRKMRAAFKRLVQVGAEHGWGEYRTHLAFMDDVANTYSFNNHALLRLHETLKDALDPNGILAPGKSGIWPKQMRKARA
ncbi:MAG TPA: FAD-binding oxidoreductase [Bryobacteraceae bacterium]